MANTFRIKRRASGGGAGAPATLANAELAFNEQTNILYYGTGTGGAGGSATSIIAIGGAGAFAALAGAAFVGAVTGVTPAANDNSTNFATTAFYAGQAGAANPTMNGAVAVGTSLLFARQDHVHPTDTSRAPLASPTFTGVPAAPTAAVDTTTTQLATTAYVTGQASASAPLMNGVAAIGTSLRYARADHVHASDTSKADLASPTFTGAPLAPTAAADTNTTQLATTGFVVGQASAVAASALGAAAVGTSLRYARADHVHAMPTLNQVGAPTASVSFNNQTLTNVADPVNPTDAANRRFVETAVSGVKWVNATLASTAGVSEVGATATTLPVGGASLTVDGVAVANGDVVLMKNQATAARNGVYVVSGVGTSVLLTRHSRADTAAEIDGIGVVVEDGTQAGTMWITTSDVTTLGTDAITFTQFNSGITFTAGAGMTLTGSTLDVVGTANRIQVNADSIDIHASYVGQASITTLGTITAGTWTGTAIAAANGGTGQAGGYAIGDLLQATGASALGKLAAVATGNVLISGGVGAVSSWGKVGLTTHVSGTLAVGNGGTGATTLTGYVKGAGTAALTASATIPNTDITGLGSMSTQNAAAVAITGGTIDGITLDGGTF